MCHVEHFSVSQIYQAVFDNGQLISMASKTHIDGMITWMELPIDRS
jgi:hypothetical protein